MKPGSLHQPIGNLALFSRYALNRAAMAVPGLNPRSP